jgi:hypothetical protein
LGTAADFKKAFSWTDDQVRAGLLLSTIEFLTWSTDQQLHTDSMYRQRSIGASSGHLRLHLVRHDWCKILLFWAEAKSFRNYLFLTTVDRLAKYNKGQIVPATFTVSQSP